VSEADRYDGKPFLKLLDCFVLDAIGHLDNQQASALQAMEPKFASVYGTHGSWQEIVASQMEFPEGIGAQILIIWQNGSEKMREMGMEPDPAEFTRQFVDTNFAPQD
jgi:hypothetical protein